MTTQTAPRPAAVASVLARSHEWVSARRKSDGKPFFFVPGGTPGTVYMTAEDGCTCPAARHSESGTCKHQAAVRQHQTRRQPAPAPAPKARKSYRELFPVCDVPGCDEDALRNGRCLEHRSRWGTDIIPLNLTA